MSANTSNEIILSLKHKSTRQSMDNLSRVSFFTSVGLFCVNFDAYEECDE